MQSWGTVNQNQVRSKSSKILLKVENNAKTFSNWNLIYYTDMPSFRIEDIQFLCFPMKIALLYQATNSERGEEVC